MTVSLYTLVGIEDIASYSKISEPGGSFTHIHEVHEASLFGTVSSLQSQKGKHLCAFCLSVRLNNTWSCFYNTTGSVISGGMGGSWVGQAE